MNNRIIDILASYLLAMASLWFILEGGYLAVRGIAVDGSDWSLHEIFQSVNWMLLGTALLVVLSKLDAAAESLKRKRDQGR